jgi:hypothetical protein
MDTLTTGAAAFCSVRWTLVLRIKRKLIVSKHEYDKRERCNHHSVAQDSISFAARRNINFCFVARWNTTTLVADHLAVVEAVEVAEVVLRTLMPHICSRMWVPSATIRKVCIIQPKTKVPSPVIFFVDG